MCLHDRQHLARHLDHDRVGVAIGQQAGERAAAGHAIAAGIVDDDEIDAAGLLAFGGKARARAAADDRLAARVHGAKSFEQRLRSKRGIVTSLRAAPGRLPMQRAERGNDRGGEFRIVDVCAACG